MPNILNFYRRGGEIYWEAERRLHIISLWAAPPLFVIFISVFFIQVHYTLHGDKRDMTALSPQLTERLAELKKEELMVYRYEDQLQNSLRIYDPSNRNKGLKKELRDNRDARRKLIREINEIVKQAPYNAWSYKFYRFFGLVKEKK